MSAANCNIYYSVKIMSVPICIFFGWMYRRNYVFLDWLDRLVIIVWESDNQPTMFNFSRDLLGFLLQIRDWWNHKKSNNLHFQTKTKPVLNGLDSQMCAKLCWKQIMQYHGKELSFLQVISKLLATFCAENFLHDFFTRKVIIGMWL